MLTSDQMLEIYYIIKKVIKTRRCAGLVDELKKLAPVEIEDLHHSLYVKFIEENREEQINHPLTYLEKFCFLRLMDMKKYYEQEKRAENRWQNSQYDDACNYGNCDQEEIIIDLIEKKYE